MVCVLCHTETEKDDIALPMQSGRCICLRCWEREINGTRLMSVELRRAVTIVVNEAK